MRFFLLVLTFSILLSCGGQAITPIHIQLKTWRIGETGKLTRTEDGKPVYQEILPDSLNFRCYSPEDDEKWRKAIIECRGGNANSQTKP